MLNLQVNVMLFMTDVARMCRRILENHYGDQFYGLILFGSVARDKASDASDLDLLVMLSPPFNYFKELRRIADLLYPLQLESEKLISAKPAAKDDFESGHIQLYRNAKREGLAL